MRNWEPSNYVDFLRPKDERNSNLPKQKHSDELLATFSQMYQDVVLPRSLPD